MGTDTTHRLFIYGTLAPGRSNYHVVENIAGTWEPAVLRGRLLDEGWGAASGYPAIIPSDDGDEVEGFLFSSTELPLHWPRLDDFEGSGYRRITVKVKTENGALVEAWVYALNRDD